MIETRRTGLALDSVVYGLARVLPALSGLVVTAIATRVLTTSEYGTGAAILSVVLVLSTSLFGWLRQGIFRFSGHVEDVEGHLIFGWRLFIRTALVAVVLILLGGLAFPAFVRSASGWQATGVVVLGTVGIAAFDLAVERFRILQAPRRFAWALGIRASLAVVTIGLLLSLGFGWRTVPFGMGVTSFALALLYRPRGSTRRHDNSVTARRVVGYGWPLGIAMGLGAITENVAKVSVYVAGGGIAVAALAVVHDLTTQALGAAAGAVNSAVYPQVLRDEREWGSHEALRSHTSLLGAVVATTSAIAFGIWVWGAALVGLLSGTEYGVAVRPLVAPVVLAAAAGIIRTQVLDVRFQLLHRTRRQLVGAGTACVATASLMFVAGEGLEPVLASWLLVAGQALGLVGAALALPRDLWSMRALGHTAGAALPCAAGVLPVLLGRIVGWPELLVEWVLPLLVVAGSFWWVLKMLRASPGPTRALDVQIDEGIP